ncbi:SsrA-binding protein SmpB [Candidatus Peregrinibacteria bacterium]|jgi:SsrA-binding protein|nr:SsrA-binding protein SmpB [Candidatus Peregrinibacteria bacterium]MBT4147939.1 SsrA-binding protein SmpB [Candidatus Peregrinibacteria bacterium]MBT4456105.1 SsrA-binding protein SmpB [Candidatus Peregrinibacteria bacterium]
MPKPLPDNLLAKNKKAYHDYEVLDSLEAGIQLTGPEVKSCRGHKVNLKGSFVHIQKDEAFAEAIHISPYKHAKMEDQKETRSRKLLLHRKQIDKLSSHLNEKGIALIPTKLYLKGNLIKLNIGVCRGKKLFDKRASLKKRAVDRDIARETSKKFRGA